MKSTSSGSMLKVPVGTKGQLWTNCAHRTLHRNCRSNAQCWFWLLLSSLETLPWHAFNYIDAKDKGMSKVTCTYLEQCSIQRHDSNLLGSAQPPMHATSQFKQVWPSSPTGAKYIDSRWMVVKVHQSAMLSIVCWNGGYTLIQMLFHPCTLPVLHVTSHFQAAKLSGEVAGLSCWPS